jgi:hypothetical protein
MFEVVDELYRYVAGEPRLREFLPELGQVRQQARTLARGRRTIRALPRTVTRTLPDRELARRIVEIVAKWPPIEPDEMDAESLQLCSQLLGNLVVAITHAVLISFPDLMRAPN